MQLRHDRYETGNILICVLGTILILSIIGANVLHSSATRLNSSCNQVRAWKQSLSAAESGGDIAFAEIRRHVNTDPGTWWTGWTQAGTKYTSPATPFGADNLQAQAIVEECYFSPATKVLTLGHPATGNSWYRIRSKGTAPVQGLKRTGMDDALITDDSKHFAAAGTTRMRDITARGKGDSLLRKIDFQYDHFVATYGPDGDGRNKAQVAATSAPSITRRVEQIVAPMNPFFDAVIKTSGSFYGLGSGAWIDSYNSNNGPYDPSVKDDPTSPYYGDSRHGNVEVGSATVTVKGTIYGDLATNGGNIKKTSSVTGTVDNNVPFTLEDFRPNTSSWVYEPQGTGAGQLPGSISGNESVTPPAKSIPPYGGSSTSPTYYLVSSIGGALTVNPVVVGGIALDTYVTVHVAGDISGGSAGITVKPKVHLRIYFDGNISVKANNLVNQSPISTNPYSGNLQFYGISPPRDASGNPTTTQTIDLNSGSPSTLMATFYAPSADFTCNGNPDFIGTIVSKSFYANGNVAWHYDRALNDDGEIQDYRIASYVEDTR